MDAYYTQDQNFLHNDKFKVHIIHMCASQSRFYGIILYYIKQNLWHILYYIKQNFQREIIQRRFVSNNSKLHIYLNINLIMTNTTTVILPSKPGTLIESISKTRFNTCYNMKKYCLLSSFIEYKTLHHLHVTILYVCKVSSLYFVFRC